MKKCILIKLLFITILISFNSANVVLNTKIEAKFNQENKTIDVYCNKKLNQRLFLNDVSGNIFDEKGFERDHFKILNTLKPSDNILVILGDDKLSEIYLKENKKSNILYRFNNLGSFAAVDEKRELILFSDSGELCFYKYHNDYLFSEWKEITIFKFNDFSNLDQVFFNKKENKYIFY